MAKRLGLALLLASSLAFAQGSKWSDSVTSISGKPIPFASVRVCDGEVIRSDEALQTTPCTPLANVYSDSALTQAIANPITADKAGNYGYYSAPGYKTMDFSANGMATFARIIQLSPRCSTFNVRCADQFPGADAGGKIAAAAADLPSTGGIVNAQGLQAAQLIASTVTISKPTTIQFGYATYSCSASICFQVSSAGVSFIGAGSSQGFSTDGSNNRGTIFKVSTAGGSFAVIGSDNGHAQDAAEYDGFQGTRFQNLQITNTGGITALSNGQGNYGNGSYGIRDWRGGGIELSQVSITHFQYGFWGIQSDINRWESPTLNYNSVGMYLGPRSDQNTIVHLYTFFNDIAVQIDRAWNTRFIGAQFVSDGSASIYPIKIGSAWAVGSKGTIFDDCWFEHFAGSATIPAYVSLGLGDSVQSTDISFNRPLLSQPASTVTYFAAIDNADWIELYDPLQPFINNIVTSYINFPGPSVPVNIRVTNFGSSTTQSVANNSGGGATQMVTWTHGGIGTTLGSSLNNDVRFSLDSGSSAAKISSLRYLDRGVVKFEARKIAVNDWELFSNTDSLTRIYVEKAGLTKVNSNGTSAIRFNPDNGAGTGGVEFYSGSGTSTLSAKIDSTGKLTQTGVTFSALGSPANGTLIYCSDCTIANPCAGSGNGAFAKRLNGVWVCN